MILTIKFKIIQHSQIWLRCEILKFCPKEGAFLQAYDAASLGKHLPTFRKIIFLATYRICRSEEIFNVDENQ